MSKSGLFELRGKKILVTGASSGIGRATSCLLSQLGATVILIGRNEERLRRTMEELTGDGHTYICYDLRNTDEMTGLFESIVGKDNKKLDGLVYCAGISRPIPLKSLSRKNMDETMEINFYSFIEMVKRIMNKRYSNEGASVVAVSSTAAVAPERCQTIYSASKAAVNVAVSALAIELAARKIRINSVVAGYTDTPMTRAVIEEIDEKHFEDAAKKQLLGICQPEDIANMLSFLLSDASKAATGRQFFVDGGRLL